MAKSKRVAEYEDRVPRLNCHIVLLRDLINPVNQEASYKWASIQHTNVTDVFHGMLIPSCRSILVIKFDCLLLL